MAIRFVQFSSGYNYTGRHCVSLELTKAHGDNLAIALPS